MIEVKVVWKIRNEEFEVFVKSLVENIMDLGIAERIEFKEV